jgi:hypothetical protein
VDFIRRQAEVFDNFLLDHLCVANHPAQMRGTAPATAFIAAGCNSARAFYRPGKAACCLPTATTQVE